MLTTPGGKPLAATSSATRRVVSGVSSAGLSTTVLPAASAGPSFQLVNISGKFHGTIWPDHPDRLAQEGEGGQGSSRQESAP
jgi:hypothetical protein